MRITAGQHHGYVLLACMNLHRYPRQYSTVRQADSFIAPWEILHATYSVRALDGRNDALCTNSSESEYPTCWCFYFATGAKEQFRLPIRSVSISIFDAAVFVIVALTLLFFVFRLPWSIAKLRSRPRSDLYKAYYALMLLSLVLRVVRSFLNWTVWNSTEDESIASKV